MAGTEPYDPSRDLEDVQAATNRLVQSASALTEGDLAAPSLLPGWSRGHVCAHVAANADSLVNLLTWARTGVETPQYASGDARDAAIEAGATRSPAEHVRELESSAARFVAGVLAVPAERWSAEVTWRGGRRSAASTVLWARHREVEIHHVDLGMDYSPAHWSEAFSGRVLANAASTFRSGAEPVDFDLHALDTGGRWQTTDAPAPVVVSGPQAALLAWLIGRSDGDGLVVDGPDGHGAPLPTPPPWL